MTSHVPLRRVYLSDPVGDALTNVVCELTAELWAVKRRLRLLEAELEARGGTPLDEVPISDDEAQASALAAREFVTSVLGALQGVPGEGAQSGASG